MQFILYLRFGSYCKGIIKFAHCNSPEMRKIIVLTGFICMAFGVIGQKSYDYGLFLGTTQNHSSSILPIPEAGTMNFAAGGYYRYSLNERYSLRGGIIGSPAMVDAFALFEFNFLPVNTKQPKKVFSPYIATGLAYVVEFEDYVIFKAKSESLINPALSELKANYWVRNIRIPFNVGVKYNITPKLTVSAEWALRKGYQKDYTLAEPIYTPLIPNWRSNFSVSVGYLVSNLCKTCPFYENERKKLK